MPSPGWPKKGVVARKQNVLRNIVNAETPVFSVIRFANVKAARIVARNIHHQRSSLEKK